MKQAPITSGDVERSFNGYLMAVLRPSRRSFNFEHSKPYKANRCLL